MLSGCFLFFDVFIDDRIGENSVEKLVLHEKLAKKHRLKQGKYKYHNNYSIYCGGIVMFGVKGKKERKKFMGLVSTLETVHLDPFRSDAAYQIASEMCIILKATNMPLSISEKVNIVKSMNRAKVKAFQQGPQDGYHAYKNLTSVGTHLVRLL